MISSQDEVATVRRQKLERPPPCLQMLTAGRSNYYVNCPLVDLSQVTGSSSRSLISRMRCIRKSCAVIGSGK